MALIHFACSPVSNSYRNLRKGSSEALMRGSPEKGLLLAISLANFHYQSTGVLVEKVRRRGRLILRTQDVINRIQCFEFDEGSQQNH